MRAGTEELRCSIRASASVANLGKLVRVPAQTWTTTGNAGLFVRNAAVSVEWATFYTYEP